MESPAAIQTALMPLAARQRVTFLSRQESRQRSGPDAHPCAGQTFVLLCTSNAHPVASPAYGRLLPLRNPAPLEARVRHPWRTRSAAGPGHGTFCITPPPPAALALPA